MPFASLFDNFFLDYFAVYSREPSKVANPVTDERISTELCAISGLAGSGKTAIAQSMYLSNHPRPSSTS